MTNYQVFHIGQYREIVSILANTDTDTDTDYLFYLFLAILRILFDTVTV